MTSTDAPAVVIRPARTNEGQVIADLIATAFHDIPPTAWLISDPDIRTVVFPAYLAIFVNHALRNGHIDVAADPTTNLPAAVTLWWPHDTQPANYATQLSKIVPRNLLPRFGVFDGLMEYHHIASPHLYLGFAATHPTRQGTGIGTTLISHRLTDLDTQGELAFLIAGSEDSARLYRRLGFSDLTPYQLPDGPCMYPQWCDPHPIATVHKGQ